jgi:hypothetical protein
MLWPSGLETYPNEEIFALIISESSAIPIEANPKLRSMCIFPLLSIIEIEVQEIQNNDIDIRKIYFKKYAIVCDA